MLASGGGQHLLDDCIRWILCQRSDPYHMAYERWFTNGMKRPAPSLADASQPPIGEDSLPADITTTSRSPAEATVDVADADVPGSVSNDQDDDIVMDDVEEHVQFGIRELSSNERRSCPLQDAQLRLHHWQNGLDHMDELGGEAGTRS